MTRRAAPFVAAASVVCAMTLCPCLANAQIDVTPQVSAQATSELNQLPVPKLKELKDSESQSSSNFTPSIGQLFSKTLNDFRRLPSLDSAVIMGMGAAAASIGHPSDARISRGMIGSDSKQFFSAGQMIGASTVQLGAAFATYSLGRATGHPKVTEIGADLVSAQIVSQTLTQAIKFSVGRTRPDGTSYSFPSGHSATAFATAAVLQRHLGWKAGIPAYAVASYVAASRVEVQRHYLSDVAFGAAIGIMSGRTVTLGRGNARFAISPAVAPGGAGVNFNWIGRK